MDNCQTNRINEILHQINKNLKEINEKVKVGNEEDDRSFRQTLHHCGENIQRLIEMMNSPYESSINDQDSKPPATLNPLKDTHKNEIKALNHIMEAQKEEIRALHQLNEALKEEIIKLNQRISELHELNEKNEKPENEKNLGGDYRKSNNQNPSYILQTRTGDMTCTGMENIKYWEKMANHTKPFSSYSTYNQFCEDVENALGQADTLIQWDNVKQAAEQGDPCAQYVLTQHLLVLARPKYNEERCRICLTAYRYLLMAAVLGEFPLAIDSWDYAIDFTDPIPSFEKTEMGQSAALQWIFTKALILSLSY